MDVSRLCMAATTAAIVSGANCSVMARAAFMASSSGPGFVAAVAAASGDNLPESRNCNGGKRLSATSVLCCKSENAEATEPRGIGLFATALAERSWLMAFAAAAAASAAGGGGPFGCFGLAVAPTEEDEEAAGALGNGGPLGGAGFDEIPSDVCDAAGEAAASAANPLWGHGLAATGAAVAANAVASCCPVGAAAAACTVAVPWGGDSCSWGALVVSCGEPASCAGTSSVARRACMGAFAGAALTVVQLKPTPQDCCDAPSDAGDDFETSTSPPSPPPPLSGSAATAGAADTIGELASVGTIAAAPEANGGGIAAAATGGSSLPSPLAPSMAALVPSTAALPAGAVSDATAAMAPTAPTQLGSSLIAGGGGGGWDCSAEAAAASATPRSQAFWAARTSADSGGGPAGGRAFLAGGGKLGGFGSTFGGPSRRGRLAACACKYGISRPWSWKMKMFASA
mmetsp:Transcript_144753/g.376665  ORF Transcript_144753/g.376665 Transcript_144753/m.376665 type:complete len:457 (-) Transcript_144753:247-1617(-)